MQAMDAVGGELNASTAKEHTCYYAHVLGSDLPLAVDLVADGANGCCAADDVDRVVTSSEETATRDDDPEDGGHVRRRCSVTTPVGRLVIGSAQTVPR